MDAPAVSHHSQLSIQPTPRPSFPGKAVQPESGRALPVNCAISLRPLHQSTPWGASRLRKEGGWVKQHIADSPIRAIVPQRAAVRKPRIRLVLASCSACAGSLCQYESAVLS